MPGAARLANFDGGEGQNTEEVAIPLTRRRIYLQRLVGDNVFGKGQGHGPRAPVQVVLRFLVYLIVATVVITTRSKVADIFDINDGLQEILAETGVIVDEASASQLYFSDIRSRAEMELWVKHAVFHNILGDEEDVDFRNNLTLLTYNRVVPLQGSCSNTATVAMTLRRVDTSRNASDSITDRFAPLYPRIWFGNRLVAGEPQAGEREEEATMPGLDGTHQWAHTTGKQGYQEAGGYVALATLDEQGQTFVHLLDYLDAVPSTEATGVDTSEHICTDMPVSSSLTLEDFWRQNFFDDNFASLALQFLVYNSNLQTMSRVDIKFNANFAGLIVDKGIYVESIRLDIYSPTMKYLEVAYVIFTGCYLLAFIRSAYKTFPSYFSDMWTWINLVSISMSLTSLTLWYSYEPMLSDYLTNGHFRDLGAFAQCFNRANYYKRASALATLMIYLRLVQFLAGMEPRVLLLTKTLKVGAGNMAIYICYVGVILCGSAAFAQTYFSSFSLEFVDPGISGLNCYNLFFGNIESLKTIDARQAPLKNLFYVMFMVFFYFVSVQMFNAIINYSYNLVSEEMEPQFEQQRVEKKRRAALESQRRGGHQHHRLLKRLEGFVHKHIPAAEFMLKWILPKDGDPADNQKAREAQAAHDEKMEQMDEAAKSKVEMYLQRNNVSQIPDGTFNIVLFWIFAISYIAFLQANLSINDNFQINRALQNSIDSFPTRLYQGNFLDFDDILTVPHAAQWMQGSLPAIIFNTTPAETKAAAVALGVYDETAVCLKTWNCLIGLESPVNSTKKLLRITQRRALQVKNHGAFNSDTPERFRFAGERLEGSSMDASEQLAPMRLLTAIDPRSSPELELENSSELELNPALRGFCQVAEPDNELSFGGNGGLVCMLDADETTFLSQIELLMENEFFTPESSAWVVDFAMQNSNRQILTYVSISFSIKQSGKVETDITSDSIRLFNFAMWHENTLAILLRLAPGIVYLGLTFRFIYNLQRDFWKLVYKTRMQSKHHLLGITLFFRFFRYDIFNFLEAVSIGVSLFSAVLFFMWCVRDSSLNAMKEGSFEAFLAYCQTLVSEARLYNRLSAVNILMIGVRPLKFVRENPRIAKLNKTMWDASVDLRWFVVMLFITMYGFVMFAYISFGPHVTDCSSLWSTLVYCFRFLLGDFDYTLILKIDPVMAIFMFPYLMIMYCVFTNIFFAIIDRHFVSIEPPPVQWKLKLKPLFGRICRCINWDEDYVMEEDPNAEKKEGPPSRRGRVQVTQRKIQALIQNAAAGGASFAAANKIQDLAEVSELDLNLEDVHLWSMDEAHQMVLTWARLSQKKRNASSEEMFVKQEVMKAIRKELRENEEEMEEAGRQMRYAVRVHEKMAIKDQDTLARYIYILEKRIHKLSTDKNNLGNEVRRLKNECQKMRERPGNRIAADTQDQLGDSSPGRRASARSVTVAGPAAAAEEDQAGGESSSSDSDNEGGQNSSQAGQVARGGPSSFADAQGASGGEAAGMQFEDPACPVPMAVSTRPQKTTKQMLEQIDKFRKPKKQH